MSANPEVSVVMSVYNGASHPDLRWTASCRKRGLELEFIVVNDGSAPDERDQILDD